MNYPLPAENASELRIIHITDTHLLDSADDLLYGLNTRSNLQKVLFQALTTFPAADLLLFTGDISQTGSESSYRIFHSIIADLEIPVLCLPGNHDNPRLLQKVIPGSPADSAVFLKQNNYSIVLLNSCVDQAHYGELDENCLEQMQQFLQTSGSRFHVFAIHHTPVSINSKWLDELGLKNQSRLLNMILESNTPSLLLSGHIHQPLDLQMNLLRILATPSTCHQFKMQSTGIQYLSPSFASYRTIKISLPDQIQTRVHYIVSSEQDRLFSVPPHSN